MHDVVHTYNSPGLSAHEFLLAVMRDQTLALQTRINAAGDLCRAGLGDIGTVRTLHIVIETGYIPTDIEVREILLLFRIWASGQTRQTLTSIGYFDDPPSSGLIADMPVKGHA